MTQSPSSSTAARPLPALGESVRSIYRLMRPAERRALFRSLLVIVLAALVSASVPMALAALLEHSQGVGLGASPMLVWFMLAFVLVRSVSLMVDEAQFWAFTPLIEGVSFRIGEALAVAATALHLSSKAAADHGGTGALQERIMKARGATYTLVHALVIGFLSIFIQIAVVSVVVANLIGWHAPLVILASGGVYWVCISLWREKETEAHREVLGSHQQYAARIAEMVAGARLVHEYAAEGYFRGRIADTSVRFQGVLRRQRSIQVRRAAAMCLGLFVTYGTGLLYAAFVLPLGEIGVGSVFMLVTLVDRIVAPLNNASHSVSAIKRSLAALSVCEELGVFGPQRTVQEAMPHEVAAGRQADIRVHVGQAQPLLLRAGESLLVRGPSGSGKSSLLCRLYEQAAGQPATHVDPHRMNELIACVPAGQICYLPGGPAMAPGSVRDNVLLGIPADRQHELAAVWDGVWQHAEASGPRVALDALTTTLSAGERQRVALARALLHHPRVLMLDEATNALDLPSERAVWRFIRQWLPQASVLVAAHRAQTFLDADHHVDVRDGVAGLADREAAAGGGHRHHADAGLNPG